MPSDLSHYPEFWDSVFGVLLSRYHSSEIVTSLSGPPPVLVTCCAPALQMIAVSTIPAPSIPGVYGS